MNHTLTGIAGALSFVWLGMVLGISFLEAPLKFRAPGVTIPLGLGIGRIVFRALNRIEVALAVLITALVAVGGAAAGPLVAVAVVIVLLVVQLGVVRPRLNRRSERVLAEGAEGSRSRAHIGYVALEAAKVVALAVLGVLALAA